MYILISAFMIFLLMIPSPSKAMDMVFKVEGELVSSTCSVSSGSEETFVEMGEVSSKNFFNQEASDFVKFTINLEDCGLGVENVYVLYMGMSEPKNPNLVALNEVPDSAKNIALGLYNKDKTIIPIWGMSSAYKVNHDERINSLDFYARYHKIGSPVEPGYAEADATFVLAYD